MQILAMHGILGLANEAWLAPGRDPEDLASALRPTSSNTASAVGAARPEGRIEALQSAGQHLLLLDRTDDAADHFERCLKEAFQRSRVEHRARSCLITGLQALHHHQLRTGWSCLQRVIQQQGAPATVLVGAYGALAALYFRLGMRRPAHAAVDRALSMVPRDLAQHEATVAVLEALRVEFMALDLLRQHEQLHDLAFWPRHEEVAGGRVGIAEARAAIDACRRRVEGFRFARARLDFLEAILRIAHEDAPQEGQAMAHIESLNRLGLDAHVHAARHELALACVAARRPQRLRQLMDIYAGGDRMRRGQQHNLEHDYCLAKLGELSGAADLYITHYRKYAVQSLLRMRQTCAYITVPSTVRQGGDDIPRDDIASRLHGRYRHAYQFILANLHRGDLSIRDVADEIGVTERALQLAFRSALGLSPSAVIRQCRMDRIHDELSSGIAAHEAGTQAIGRRWGLRSRSALSQAYKAAFGELPSQTDARSLA